MPIGAAFPALPIQRLDIRIKLLGLLTVLIWTFLFEDPLYHLGIFLVMTIIIATIQFPVEKIKALLLPLLPLFLLIIFFTGFTYTPERFHLATSRWILWYILPGQRLGVTFGGIMLGLTFLLRVTVLATSSAIFTAVSPVDELLQLFQKLKVPYEISFIIITALRFIPTLDRKRQLILDAQKARGANLQGKSLKNRFHAQIPVMIPLIINSIIMADTLSMAMLNRGFGYAATRTNFRELSFAKGDYWACCIILLVLGCGFSLRFCLQLGRL